MERNSDTLCPRCGSATRLGVGPDAGLNVCKACGSLFRKEPDGSFTEMFLDAKREKRPPALVAYSPVTSATPVCWCGRPMWRYSDGWGCPSMSDTAHKERSQSDERKTL